MKQIANPKRHIDPIATQERKIFPYYAGYSESFALSAIEFLSLEKESIILDPWNGSGTTTVSSYKTGFNSIGVDLNPTMVLVAKAAFLPPADLPSIKSLAYGVTNAKHALAFNEALKDPLKTWFEDETAVHIRALESNINSLLVNESRYIELTCGENIEPISPLAAFFYVALFRATRNLAKEFIGSNPTWIRKPKNNIEKVTASREFINNLFIEESLKFTSLVSSFYDSKNPASAIIKLGNSKDLPLRSKSTDAVITSPPYCTRIDYAVATAIELV